MPCLCDPREIRIAENCPQSKTGKKLEDIRNFKQEGDETLYQAWERHNDLLYKCPTHNINSHQKVNIFYNGLSTMNRQLLDLQGPIPSMTLAQALMAIQTMADHSQKWYDGSSSRSINNNNNSNTEGIAAIVSKLDILGRDMKKLKENVHAIQVGCPPRYYTCIDNRPPFKENKSSLEEFMNKHLEESTQRRAEMEEWVKKLQENPDINTQNQSASLKNLETQIEQLTKEFHAKNCASINVIPRSIFKYLKLTNLKETDMTVVMADMTEKTPLGIIENFLQRSRFCDDESIDTFDSNDKMHKPEDGHKKVKNFEKITSRWHKGQNGMLKQWMCFRDHERQSIGGNHMIFAEFLKVSKSIRNEVHNEWVTDSFDVEVDFGKIRDDPYSTRYAQDDVWEKCEKFHDTTYQWYNEGFEEEEEWESGIKKTDYEPPFVKSETFEVKRYSFKNGKRSLSKELDFKVSLAHYHVVNRGNEVDSVQEFNSHSK
ncbi:hypothetical protein Tco_0532851 [Tanacetum coccineum]